MVLPEITDGPDVQGQRHGVHLSYLIECSWCHSPWQNVSSTHVHAHFPLQAVVVQTALTILGTAPPISLSPHDLHTSITSEVCQKWRADRRFAMWLLSWAISWYWTNLVNSYQMVLTIPSYRYYLVGTLHSISMSKYGSSNRNTFCCTCKASEAAALHDQKQEISPWRVLWHYRSGTWRLSRLCLCCCCPSYPSEMFLSPCQWRGWSAILLQSHCTMTFTTLISDLLDQAGYKPVIKTDIST
jgi:hypothetical protein